ncbi:RNA ligase family protein [Shimazuella kribbensis]|uniref:ATP-dependent DNA ligase n=1 Tax=Shimazuella kribbensis TaxID=139808 RepID=UPI000426338D|nr:RNA ligase family protein [Shimazuella kribbensis]
MCALVKPMEPVLSNQLLVDPNLVYQVKWDGIRILAKIENGNVLLHTRNGNVRSFIYPEIRDILTNKFAKQTLYLDGEMITINKGKADFFQVAKRDRMKTASKIQQYISKIPVSYIVFDILQYNDWITDKPLHERLSILHETIEPTDKIQVCPTTTDGESLFHYTKNQGWEGIVLKEKNGKYHLGVKHPTWKKIKHFQYVTATVLGVTLKSGSVYSLLLGKRERGEWIYIGRVSSGLSTEEKQILTIYSNSLSVSNPVTAIPAFKEEEIRWFSPNMQANIRFLEWTPDATLRNPVIESFLK